ncbi:hypothetical protein [Clostridium manihotivorum]|uniref:Uncharacterized protein n=1 Tax=Clostridium manihotivorum TaxID=2320868 RepID=A0A410DV28_9CLOT|nr:hypothetical protein [Clostridium manihotivorum]QAA33063.1 hypothetical protein C1I91_16255 [Clostridium manihotivorum]
MERLYDTYTDEDLIILIGKKSNVDIKVVYERDFQLDDYVDSNYEIFCYSPTYKILNNGYRHIYEKEVYRDLSNLKITYNETGDLEEVGLLFEQNYIPFYINYDQSRLASHIKELIRDISTSFENYVFNNFKDISLHALGVFYFYDGEAIDINLTIGTSEEKEALDKEKDDTEYLGNYSIRATMDEYLKHKLDTLILSIAKDKKADETEILKYIVESIDKNLSEINWKNKTLTDENFTYHTAAMYD